MGLSVAGRLREAEMAYRGWRRRNCPTEAGGRRPGTAFRRTRPATATSPPTSPSGFTTISSSRANSVFSDGLWPTLEAGIDYAVGLQADTGEIHWAKNGEGVVDRMALLTGSSSVYMSLKCALAIAALLGKRRSDWEAARQKLGDAIRHRPGLFNMMKARYSMDWYYPVLCGAVTGEEARKRIDRSWEKFVVPEWGVRCVCDQSLGHDRGGLRTGPDAGGGRRIRAGGHRLQLDLRQKI